MRVEVGVWSMVDMILVCYFFTLMQDRIVAIIVVFGRLKAMWDDVVYVGKTLYAPTIF